MFTLEQVREFTQKVDDYVNNAVNKAEAIGHLLRLIEPEFVNMFQEDHLTSARHQYFTFRISETYYCLLFQNLGSSSLRMFCINEFTEDVDGGGLTVFHFGENVPAHEFIYNHCNPEGVLRLEKILFEEVI